MSRRKICEYLIQQQLFEPSTTNDIIETSSETQLEPNVCGLKPVQLMNIFSAGVSLSLKNKRLFSVQEKDLCIFTKTSIIWIIYYYLSNRK